MNQTLPAVAVQLYSLRHLLHDLHNLVPRLATEGFTAVELCGSEFDVLEAAELASLFQDHGVSVSSALVGFGRDGRLHEGQLDGVQAVGSDTAIVPYLPPEKFTDLAGVQWAADHLALLADQVASRGMTLGYHNHFWELGLLDGRPALLELFERTDHSVVSEVDIYWAKVGGVDPAQLVADLGDRARFLHVKDGPADDREADMVAVGAGAIDVPAALSANPAVRWHIIELDRCASDMFQAVVESRRYLAGLGLSATPR